MKDLQEIKSKIEDDKIIAKIMLDLIPKINIILNKNINKKVILLDGALTKKLKSEINVIFENARKKYDKYDNKVKNSFQLHYLMLRKYYFFEINLSICFSNGDGIGCHYAAKSFVIGELKEGILISVNSDLSEFQKMQKINYASVEKRLIRVSKEIEKINEIQKGLPYYARYTMPYVSINI